MYNSMHLYYKSCPSIISKYNLFTMLYILDVNSFNNRNLKTNIMKKLLVGLIILGLTTQGFAQIETEKLSEVEVLGTNYKYISKIDLKEVALPVKQLHKRVANYDLVNNGVYNEEYDTHYISFYIPEGYILAAYNNDGELLRTTEKFKDVQIPEFVKNVVLDTYPGWEIAGDIYYITYHHKKGVTKEYKILLSNNGKRKSIKIDAEGEFL